jgi:hypothetical protein
VPESLVVDLGRGFRELLDALPIREAAAVARARVFSNAGRGEQTRGLFALVELYRAGPRQVWAPILLDVLAPGLLRSLQRLREEPPFMDPGDIAQQLVVELLHAAAYMPLPEDPAHLRRRLLARANQGVRRILARERRRQSGQVAFVEAAPVAETRRKSVAGFMGIHDGG